MFSQIKTLSVVSGYLVGGFVVGQVLVKLGVYLGLESNGIWTAVVYFLAFGGSIRLIYLWNKQNEA